MDHFALVDRRGRHRVDLHLVGHFSLAGRHQEDRSSLVGCQGHRLEALRLVDRCALEDRLWRARVDRWSVMDQESLHEMVRADRL